ncbi:MAG: efflux RND transporter periplasmic adaptor subunit [Candidatus Hydrogenedentes bacterium]|nr:efflux RND transporter periplasmic adaptor subunit [Candidatus Hydrogenedentota bacterium]
MRASTCAFIFCALAILGCGNSYHASAPPATGATVQAKVSTASLASTPRTREAVGTVRSATTSAIQSKVMGHVVAVLVKAGDVVEANAVLAELDARDATALVKSAESALRVAERGLDEATKGVAAVQSAAQAAEAQRDLASTTFDRQSKLLAEKAISKQVFDEAAAAAKSAAAEARMRIEEVAAVLAKREQANAAVEQARAALDAANVTLSYTRVTAPFAGIVATKTVDVGDLAAPGMTLFSLEDRSAYRLEASVDETSAASVHVNDTVQVAIDGLGDTPMDGTVSEIFPAADPSSRTSMVKIALPADDRLRSGQFGRARFPSADAAGLAVPRTAVVSRGQLEGVYALNTESIATLRLVKTGKIFGDTVEILSGLREGDRYVAEVTPEVVDGVRIDAR